MCVCVGVLGRNGDCGGLNIEKHKKIQVAMFKYTIFISRIYFFGLNI